nr:VOC family protein [Stenotrophomonas maltophilia]
MGPPHAQGNHTCTRHRIQRSAQRIGQAQQQRSQLLGFQWRRSAALHAHLVTQGTPIVFAPKDGPFGRYFAFRDPFGYTITPHTVGKS